MPRLGTALTREVPGYIFGLLVIFIIAVGIALITMVQSIKFPEIPV